MTIQSIIRWFKTAKPKPTAKDQIRQIAYHAEEFAEMMNAIGRTDMHVQAQDMRVVLITDASHDAEAKYFINRIDDAALLDALCDQIVTAIGVGVLLGYDMEKALAEVNRSNYTKFNPDGTPYIRPDGKIGKNPITYQEPQLKQFTGK